MKVRWFGPSLFSFANLVMMSSAPAKSEGDARYASQDPFIQLTLSHTISTPNCIRSALFLRRTQLLSVLTEDSLRYVGAHVHNIFIFIFKPVYLLLLRYAMQGVVQCDFSFVSYFTSFLTSVATRKCAVLNFIIKDHQRRKFWIIDKL